VFVAQAHRGLLLCVMWAVALDTVCLAPSAVAGAVAPQTQAREIAGVLKALAPSVSATEPSSKTRMSATPCSSTLDAAPHTAAGAAAVRRLGLLTAHLVVAQELAPLFARLDHGLAALDLTDPAFARLAAAVRSWAAESSQFIGARPTSYCDVLRRWQAAGYPKLGAGVTNAILGITAKQGAAMIALSSSTAPVARTLVDAESAATARAAKLGVELNFN
jgi:hypothetical protein